MVRYAFGRYAYTIQNNIDQLHNRMKPLNKVSFTHDEFLALMAPEEHWPILKQAAEVSTVEASGGYHAASFRNKRLKQAQMVNIYFDVEEKGAPLMPRGTAVLSKAPPELLDRLADWINREVEVATQFKRAKQLFAWLDANMATKQQVRFVWPTIVTLCSMHEYTAKLTDQLREFKPQRTLPSIPLEVRAAAKETSGLLTAASMLEERIDEDKPQVGVRFHSAKFAEPLVEGALGDITP